MKRFLTRPKTILWILFLLLFFTFIFQNVEPIELKFLWFPFFTLPKLALILIAMAIGALLALLIRWEISRSRHAGKAPEAELPPQPGAGGLYG